MILDDPDEDADNLDDEDVLEGLLGTHPLEAGVERLVTASDWPLARQPGGGIALEGATLAWFKANHADWQQEIATILRAWVAARTHQRRENLPRIQPTG